MKVSRLSGFPSPSRSSSVIPTLHIKAGRMGTRLANTLYTLNIARIASPRPDGVVRLKASKSIALRPILCIMCAPTDILLNGTPRLETFYLMAKSLRSPPPAAYAIWKQHSPNTPGHQVDVILLINSSSARKMSFSAAFSSPLTSRALLILREGV